jgi:hypothetical protein
MQLEPSGSAMRNRKDISTGTMRRAAKSSFPSLPQPEFDQAADSSYENRRVTHAFFAATRRLLVCAAFLPAARAFFVLTAFLAVCSALS